MDADDTLQFTAARSPVDRLVAVTEQRRLGEYNLVAELARSGMAIVYLGVRRGELAVVKELRREFRQDSALVKIFTDEARLAVKLKHPNIMQALEAGTQGGSHYLVLEYLEGQSLHQLVHRALARSKRAKLPMHLRAVIDILSALECAHSAIDPDRGGVVHGDVNPHNVFLTYDGQVKVCDFGISDTFGSLAGESREGVHDPAIRYMAPEHAGGRPVDARADLFGVGVMLWEAIVDRGLWDGRPDGTVREKLRSGAVPRVRDAWPYIDPGLAAIVDRSMSVEPSLRYQTALEMRRDLERYIVTRQIRVPGSQSLGELVTRLFAEDREMRRAKVVELLRSVANVDASAAPASLAATWTETAPATQRPAPRQLANRELTAPVASPHASRNSPAMWLIAVAACLGAFLPFAAGSATRPRSANERAVTPPSVVSVATVERPPIPLVSVDEIPRVPAVAASPAPSAPPPVRSHPMPATPTEPAASAIAPTSGCEPPYTVDAETGKKQWRLECL